MCRWAATVETCVDIVAHKIHKLVLSIFAESLRQIQKQVNKARQIYAIFHFHCATYPNSHLLLIYNIAKDFATKTCHHTY